MGLVVGIIFLILCGLDFQMTVALYTVVLVILIGVISEIESPDMLLCVFVATIVVPFLPGVLIVNEMVTPGTWGYGAALVTLLVPAWGLGYGFSQIKFTK